MIFSAHPARTQRTVAPVQLSRRAVLRALGLGSAALVLGPHPVGLGTVLADGESHEAPLVARSAPGAISYSLAGPHDGPLPVGRSKSDYGVEIGSSTFDADSYVIHLHPFKEGLARREEWLSRRIGEFSFKNGAVMVSARDDVNPTGKAAYAIEMRKQAYKQRRYIRSNWLWVQPSALHVHIQSDGLWGKMDKIAEDPGATGAVRPDGQWNHLLFIAQGDHLEGWVNGLKVVEAEDGRFGSGQISLVALRRDGSESRVQFRDLRIWPNQPPDPTTVWDGLDLGVPSEPMEDLPAEPHHHQH